MEWRVRPGRKTRHGKTRPWLVQGGRHRRTVNNFTRWKTIHEYGFGTKGEAVEEMEKLNLIEAQKTSFANRGKQND